MDPSFKQYAFQTGLDIATVSTVVRQAVADNFINSGTINETEGWVSGFDPTILENAQARMRTESQTYLTSQPTPPTVGDVIGGRNTILQDDKGFAGSLPNRVVAKSATMDRLLFQCWVSHWSNFCEAYDSDAASLSWATKRN